MAIKASVALCRNEFVAHLSDGREIGQRNWHDLAEALFCAGVHARDVSFDWHPGQRMITAGQQVGLRAEIRRLGQEVGLHEAAA